MKRTFFLLFLTVILAGVFEIRAQKQIVCDGKKITINEKDTFVLSFDLTFVANTKVLNGNALSLPKPVYPKKAAEKKIRGAVMVQARIDEEGNVASATAVAGHDLLRPPAVEAALKAKFKKLLVDCQPREYAGIIIYNFTGDEESKKSENAAPENNVKRINLGDVTKKAVYLPPPRVPFNFQFPRNSIVRVKVIIDALSGKVIEAKAVSGLPKLRPFAEEVALCARFVKTNDVRAQVVGDIVYKFDDSNKSSMMDGNGGVLNGKAISLPNPVLPPDTDFSGSITVRVNLDEAGNVISAKAVSGKVCAGEAAVEAAKKAKFTRTLLSGVPVKVSGIIVYNFPAKEDK